MKLVGVIWNSVFDQKLEILKAIEKYAKIEKCVDMDLRYKLHRFIDELYDYPSEEKWKTEIKYNGLKSYKNKTISIVSINIDPGEKILNEKKNRMMFANVLALKNEVRDRFAFVVKNGKKQEIYREDCFHLADDDVEYDKQKKVIDVFEAKR